MEIKKKGKLGSKSATGPSQSFTFEERNFHGLTLSETISKSLKSFENYLMAGKNTMSQMGKLSKKVTRKI